ncbi:ubl carboxyl-terminal hydrolase 18-like [Rhincodon typus]|uniref:ubl carboxyl-terminal hydrolase 18-like n=1 Tax=Rhincodon typus TaxID=259920 RepID=UPI00202F95F9|nr:ubl carboxyl-terminal hydrolase 18-like [Rhincodon typus]
MNSLNGFFEPQNLDDDNKCYCDQCGEKTTTQHGYRVRSWPQILCLQLKHFGFAASLRKVVKNNNFMEFPESINSENCKKEFPNLKNIPQYKLMSVIVHKDIASLGHYYAYIRNVQEMEWYCFNDEHVTGATWEDVKKTFGSSSSPGQFQMSGIAYLLFYKRMD